MSDGDKSGPPHCPCLAPWLSWLPPSSLSIPGRPPGQGSVLLENWLPATLVSMAPRESHGHLAPSQTRAQVQSRRGAFSPRRPALCLGILVGDPTVSAPPRKVLPGQAPGSSYCPPGPRAAAADGTSTEVPEMLICKNKSWCPSGLFLEPTGSEASGLGPAGHTLAFFVLVAGVGIGIFVLVPGPR